MDGVISSIWVISVTMGWSYLRGIKSSHVCIVALSFVWKWRSLAFYYEWIKEKLSSQKFPFFFLLALFFFSMFSSLYIYIWLHYIIIPIETTIFLHKTWKLMWRWIWLAGFIHLIIKYLYILVIRDTSIYRFYIKRKLYNIDVSLITKSY